MANLPKIHGKVLNNLFMLNVFENIIIGNTIEKKNPSEKYLFS